MLKYLFTATFQDGSILRQTPEDRSITEPEKRSAFFDVQQRENELVKFALQGEGHTYGVDVRDGHFEIDGVSFFLHDFRPADRYRIIFYRSHLATKREVLHGCLPQVEVRDVIDHYAIGWQTIGPDGQNRQEIIRIK